MALHAISGDMCWWSICFGMFWHTATKLEFCYTFMILFCDTYFGQFASECIDTAAKLEWNDNMLMIETPTLSENDKIVFTQLLEYTILLWKLPGWHKLWQTDKPGPSGQLVLSWCDDKQNLKTLHVCCRNAENNLFCFEKLNFQNVCSKNLNIYELWGPNDWSNLLMRTSCN